MDFMAEFEQQPCGRSGYRAKREIGDMGKQGPVAAGEHLQPSHPKLRMGQQQCLQAVGVDLPYLRRLGRHRRHRVHARSRPATSLNMMTGSIVVRITCWPDGPVLPKWTRPLSSTNNPAPGWLSSNSTAPAGSRWTFPRPMIDSSSDAGRPRKCRTWTSCAIRSSVPGVPSAHGLVRPPAIVRVYTARRGRGRPQEGTRKAYTHTPALAQATAPEGERGDAWFTPAVCSCTRAATLIRTT